MNLGKWIKIKDEKYEREHPPDFITHLNYVSCINMISNNIKLSCNLSIKSKIKESKILKKKINLMNLTLKSIEGEYNTILKNPDYAELCVSWISVKSYYLIYNLLLILEYLLSGSDSSFSFTHKRILNRFKYRLEKKELYFNKINKKIFNLNFQCSKIMSLRVKSGANIKIIGFNLKERIIQILKKIVDYKLEDFKREEKIKNFRSNINIQKKKEFLENNTVNLHEFFYWYRIKANYRDLEFLNKDIGSYKFREFYRNYFELTLTFFNAFKGVINDLAKIRLGKTIL